MPPLNALVGQPGNVQPPNVQGTSGTDQPSGLQSLIGGAQAPAGASMQPPSHQETVALLQHLSAFRRRWAAMLADPEAGQKNMRSAVYDMMADMLADDYASLPDVMGLLKTMPTEPLEQKQWIAQHMQRDDQAMAAVLQHRAMSGPSDGQGELVTPDNRADLVRGVVSRYKAHPKRQTEGKGIPRRG